MTATFAADVTLRTTQTKLAQIGQWLPIDGDADCPLGDLISFNSTGPLRFGYGAWRDLLLGVQFTNGRGELISAGGRTVKNVAGYDLTKFMVGSAGVFGKIVTLTVRTYRRPAAALVARHRADVGILNRLMLTSLRPQWAMLTADALLCGYIGDESTMEYFRATVGQSEPLAVEQRSVDEDIAARGGLWRVHGPLTFRAAVPPMRIAEFTARAGGEWVADAAFGIVLGSGVQSDRIASVREAAASVGGSVRFLHRAESTGQAQPTDPHPYPPPEYQGREEEGAPPAKDGDTPGDLSLADLSTNPVERQIIERLKSAFDPDGVLNPLPWQTR
ncbi:MAG: putative FAD-linked oxidoreductase [Phycisphaerales bacterium]|nr:putative FAD-linked oxidoreductase [Phycisphaerales bacterium]